MKGKKAKHIVLATETPRKIKIQQSRYFHCDNGIGTSRTHVVKILGQIKMIFELGMYVRYVTVPAGMPALGTIHILRKQ